MLFNAVFAIIVALSLPIIVGMRSVAPVVLCAFLSFAIAVFCGIPIAGLAGRFFEPLGFLYFLLVALPEEISRAVGLLILLKIFAKNQIDTFDLLAGFGIAIGLFEFGLKLLHLYGDGYPCTLADLTTQCLTSQAYTNVVLGSTILMHAFLTIGYAQLFNRSSWWRWSLVVLCATITHAALNSLSADSAGDIFPFQKLPLFHIGAILFYLAIIAVCRSRRSAKAV
ncbi:hypothetical protein BC374_11235 [Ensifer sp. LC13]|nr:hypothetical protein BC374_11235 [Ensifer sp. LC13]OCP05117.1 hypothetical protein BC362_15320 [Ensifer sp. LC14]OCP14469.1 hypothetical protein BBX50_11510 [Ensifer sp. LC11]OCP29129.1 hypothetical protein BC364_09635 [Ensifer sp. LC499]